MFLGNQIELWDIENASEETQVIGLGIFSTVFEVGDCFTAQAGHVGQLSNAQSFTLPDYTEVGHAMVVPCGPLL